MMNYTEEFKEMFANCCAMLSVLAENRIMAQVIFKSIPENCLEEFEENAMILLKYIEHMEK